MKNTFGSDLSLTIFGESHGRAIGAVLDGMAAGLPVDEDFSRRLHGQAPCPGRRPVHSPRGSGYRAAAVRRGERPHHRHRHCPDDRKYQHPQRRLRQNRRPSAPRPCRLHRLRQVPRLSGCARRRALLRPGDGRPCGGRCHCAGRTAPCGHRHHHPYRRVRWHCGHPLCTG